MARTTAGLAIVAVICAAGAAQAEMATCREFSVRDRVYRLRCDFGRTPGSTTLKIEYVSGECVSTAYGNFFVKQFQFVTTPPSRGNAPAMPVQYQLPVYRNPVISNSGTGSYSFGAGQTSLYSLPGTPIYAFVDVVTPGPGDPIGLNVQGCTVSYSGAATAGAMISGSAGP